MKYKLSIVQIPILALISCTPKSEEPQKPNILLLCIDDLRPELNCFGADYIHSPNIDALAAKGMIFASHYVNAPSCGPSRYTLLTGTYGSAGNNALFKRAERYNEEPEEVNPSMPEW
ncbi:MAG: sulfatase-like hydrolase/transferase, partial [Bacteroidales bacterium]|nr:sulfatase-like hydrolase/transferase [Bacteroidales bacterium]